MAEAGQPIEGASSSGQGVMVAIDLLLSIVIPKHQRREGTTEKSDERQTRLFARRWVILSKERDRGRAPEQYEYR